MVVFVMKITIELPDSASPLFNALSIISSQTPEAFASNCVVNWLVSEEASALIDNEVNKLNSTLK